MTMVPEAETARRMHSALIVDDHPLFCDALSMTLRSVAVAAMIILLLKPESLLEPGFQMSFAATIALIVLSFTVVAGWLAFRRRN